MPRAISATCLNGVVTADGATVAGAVILSEGVTQSEGYAIFDEDKVFYVAKTSADLKTAIQSINAMITKMIMMFTAVDAGFSALSGVGGAPVNAGNIPTLTTDNNNFGLTKDQLR